MRKILTSGLILLAGLSAAPSVYSDTISLCFENSPNPPFYYGEHDVAKYKPGLTVEVLRAAAKEVGVTLKLERMPWKRCILLLEKNQIDGAFEVSYKPKREEYAVYPHYEGALDQLRYLHSLSYYLYTLKDSPVTWDGNRIENIQKTLVGVAGYSIVSDLRSEGYPVLEGVSQKANLEMLLRGRVDGLAQIDSMTQSIIASRPKKFASVKKHPVPLRNKLYYLVFSKGFMDRESLTAEKMWDELANIRQSGQYEDIALKYSE